MASYHSRQAHTIALGCIVGWSLLIASVRLISCMAQDVSNAFNSRHRRSTDPHIIEVYIILDDSVYDNFVALYGVGPADGAIIDYYTHVINEVDRMFVNIGTVDPSVQIRIHMNGVVLGNTLAGIWAFINNVYLDAELSMLALLNAYPPAAWLGPTQNDYIIVVTRLDLAVEDDINGNVDSSMFGYIDTSRSFVCGNVGHAIIEDDGQRTSMKIAHFLSLSLGAKLDGGATACSAGSQNIMTPQMDMMTSDTNAEAQWTFSSCSIQAFKDYIGGLPTANCMKAHSHNSAKFQEDKALPLPGEVYSLTQQCQQQFGPAAISCETSISASMCHWGYACNVDEAGCDTTSKHYPFNGTPLQTDGEYCYFGVGKVKPTTTSTTVSPTTSATSLSTTPITPSTTISTIPSSTSTSTQPSSTTNTMSSTTSTTTPSTTSSAMPSSTSTSTQVPSTTNAASSTTSTAPVSTTYFTTSSTVALSTTSTQDPSTTTAESTVSTSAESSTTVVTTPAMVSEPTSTLSTPTSATANHKSETTKGQLQTSDTTSKSTTLSAATLQLASSTSTTQPELTTHLSTQASRTTSNSPADTDDTTATSQTPPPPPSYPTTKNCWSTWHNWHSWSNYLSTTPTPPTKASSAWMAWSTLNVWTSWTLVSNWKAWSGHRTWMAWPTLNVRTSWTPVFNWKAWSGHRTWTAWSALGNGLNTDRDYSKCRRKRARILR